MMDCKRHQPWLRAALLAYLLCSVAVAPMHQHHGGPSSDCARCTLAHTPTLLAPTSQQPVAATEFRTAVAAPDDPIADPDFLQATHSRAPPQL
jgi:hypothetical protein